MIVLIAGSLLNDLSKFKDRELYSLIAIRNGGENTIRIIDEILNKPKNANQIAKSLGLDYKTVRYHLAIICDHDYLIQEKFNNRYSYFPSEKLIRNLDEYNKIKRFLKKEKKAAI